MSNDSTPFSQEQQPNDNPNGGGFRLGFKPSLDNAATPQGPYRIAKGAGTDGNGDRFLAQPQSYRGGRDFQPSSLMHPCPACAKTDGDCRVMADSDLVLCKSHQEALSGWKFIGISSNVLWGKYYPLGDYRPAYAPQQKREPEAPKPEWSPEQWHQHYAAIRAKVPGLNPVDRADLEKRLNRAGLDPKAHVPNLAPISLSRGYLIPCPTPDGYLVKGQIRLRGDVEGGRYRWDLPSDGIDGHIGGEQPVAVWGAETATVLLTEGTGVKPYIAGQINGIRSIGAAGGMWAASPKALRAAIGSATVARLAVDAGAISNHHVLRQYQATQRLLEGWGLTFEFGWWGQETKAQPDIDEGVDPSNIQWLTPKQFWGKVPSDIRAKLELQSIAGGGKGGKGKTPSGARDFREMQSREIVHRILNPFEGREIVEVRTQAEAVDFLLKNPFTLITGATGKGKTELLAELIRTSIRNGDRTLKDFFPFTPVRSLSHAVAAAFGTPYRGCIHSILAIAPEVLRRDNTCLIYDEFEQDLYALNVSPLCREQRGLKIEKHEAAIRHAKGIVLSSATGNLKDLEYYEAVKGQTFKILHYNPPGHPKGKLVIHTGDPSTKGSDRGARATVEAMISPKSYVACDTVRAAVKAHILAQERMRDGGDEPILAHSKAAEDPRLSAMVKSSNPGAIHCEVGNPGLITTQVLQSGFSLKPQEPGQQLFENCLGIFTGHTSPPSIALQQMGRDRGSQERHVYVRHHATPPNRLARGFAPKGQGKRSDRVKSQWAADVAALEDEMHYGNFKGFEFLSGPAKDWYQKLEQQQQLEYSHYAAAFGAYAQLDGYEVEWAKLSTAQCESLKREIDLALAQPIAAAYKLDFDGYRRMMEKQERNPEEEHEIEAYLIRDYYGIPFDGDLTVEQIISEGFGKGRKALKAAHRVVWEGQAAADDQKRRESIGDFGYVWDVSCHELTAREWERLGIEALLAHSIENGRSHIDPVIREFADRLAALQGELGEGSKVLGHRLPWRGADVEAHYKAVNTWIGTLLKNKFGIEFDRQKLRVEGERVNHYTVQPDSLAALQSAVARKAESQTEKGFHPRSTPLSKTFYDGVDHPSTGAEPPPPQPEEIAPVLPAEPCPYPLIYLYRGGKAYHRRDENGREWICFVGESEWLPYNPPKTA